MERTTLLDLPYIMPAQAQKHVTHNEALAALDAIVQLSAIGTATEPPADPAEGDRHIVGAGATGDWTGKDGGIAHFADGGWRFVTPRSGWLCYVEDTGMLLVNAAGGWEPAVETGSLPMLGINASAAAWERLVVSSPSILFTHEGDDQRVKMNKAASGNTASLIFQTGYSGRAEFGLAGNDDFVVKVSPDGAAWYDGLRIDAASGAVSLPSNPAGLGLARQIVLSTKGTVFTTTSDAFQDTGLAATLTPAATTARILVRASLGLGADFWNTAPRVAIFRDATQVWPAAGGGGLSNRIYNATEPDSRWPSYCGTIEFEDAPGTLAPVTYSVRLASEVAGRNVHLNARDVDLAVIGESSISLTELAV